MSLAASFRTMPIFRAGSLGIFTMGEDAVRLTQAMETAWKASPDLWGVLYPAAVALGDPFNKARRERCLSLLEALPPRTQSKILTAYARKSDVIDRKGSAA